jgi:hypothetical protein
VACVGNTPHVYELRGVNRRWVSVVFCSLLSTSLNNIYVQMIEGMVRTETISRIVTDNITSDLNTNLP